MQQVINMLKQSIFAVSLLSVSWADSFAFAAQERETFEVSVTIPNHEFYVLPTDPGWMGREQKLTWDLVASELRPLRKHFDVKNASGGISARLEAEPYIYNGRDRIDLNVMFNNMKLTLVNAPVVSATDAMLGRKVMLEIAALKPTAGYLPGSYYGTVHMMFEAQNPEG